MQSAVPATWLPAQAVREIYVAPTGGAASRITRVLLVLFSFVVVCNGVSPTPAWAGTCDERVKWVRDTSLSITYGARTTLTNEGQQNDPSCVNNAYTVHMHIGPTSVNDFVETGYQY